MSKLKRLAARIVTKIHAWLNFLFNMDKKNFIRIINSPDILSIISHFSSHGKKIRNKIKEEENKCVYVFARVLVCSYFYR